MSDQDAQASFSLAKIAKLDSGVIRGVLSAAVPVIAQLAMLIFNLSEAGVTAQLNRFVDGVTALWIAFSLAYIAYQRLMNPTPPLTEVAVQKTEARLPVLPPQANEVTPDASRSKI